MDGMMEAKDETTVHSDDDDMYISPVISILYPDRYYIQIQNLNGGGRS